MKNITQARILNALRASWSADTAFDAGEWSPENPARGQCLVSSLVVQDYLGGELMSYSVVGDGINETHHCNVLPGGVLFDATESQYDTVQVTQTPKVTDTKGYASLREKHLANDYDRSRYELLKSRVDRALAGETQIGRRV